MTQLAIALAPQPSFLSWFAAPTDDAEALRKLARKAKDVGAISPELKPITVVLDTAQQLALARAHAKEDARRFTMLFEPDWLTGLSRQIDAVLDPDEWIEGDKPLSRESFNTLLLVLMRLRQYRRPGLGLTDDGNAVATWSRSATDRLIVECLPNGRVRWIATTPVAGINESGTMETTPDRLLMTLAAFTPDHWLKHERQ
ncbi:MAG: hypothetical protein AB7F78_05770 [Hyphomicrobiaceae bacterium]